MASKQMPRGIRNNNPGNIDYNPDTKWQGLAEPPSDGRFCRFKTPAWGIRALARTLITYQDKHRLDSVAEIINRWAPPVENDTSAYIATVARSIGVHPNDEVNVHDFRVMEPLVKAIIKHENGVQPYTQEQINEGLRRVGVVPAAPPPVAKEPEVIAGGAGGVSVTGSGVIEQVQSTLQQTTDTISPMVYYLEIAKWLLLALSVASFGFMIYRIVKRNRRISL